MTKQTVKTVLGFCPTHAHAEDAVDKLRLSGFRNIDVSTWMRVKERAVGGVLSWPAGAGVAKQDLQQHAEWVEQGGVLLSVRCVNAEWEERAEHVFRRSVAVAGAC